LAEHDQAEPIVGGAAQEAADHALRGVEPIARQVGLLHRLRHVDDEHDVDGLDLGA